MQLLAKFVWNRKTFWLHQLEVQLHQMSTCFNNVLEAHCYNSNHNHCEQCQTNMSITVVTHSYFIVSLVCTAEREGH